MPQYKLLVCTNVRYNPKHKSCAGQGSEALIKSLKQLSLETNASIEIEEIKCFGQCQRGPVMRIAPALDFFYDVLEEDLSNILKQIQLLNSQRTNPSF
jgi:NADH:ubiquinone oxidoreductase subunit E